MRLPSNVLMPVRSKFRFGTASPAAAGTNQATGTVLTSQMNAVTAANGTKAVVLPPAELGVSVFILNTVTTAALPVFPSVGNSDTINGAAANAVFTLGPGQAAWFIAINSTAWFVADFSATLNLSGLLATATEVNRAADVSTRNVALAVSTAITEAAHDGKNIIMGGAGSARTFTLPASSGAGGRYRFIVGAVNTSNYLVKAAAGTDTFDGTVLNSDSDTSGALRGFTAAATDDTLTLNGSTQGGAAIGDWVQFDDIAANQWAVTGSVTATGSPATPFSDTVA